MAASNVVVQMSGSTAAFLSYDVMNALGDQEGFLIGKINTKVMDAVSDSEEHFQTKEIVIRIEGHIPCTRLFAYYDGSGKVNRKSINAILSGKNIHHDLLGCYRFRRNSTLEPFLRETLIHRNVLRLLPDDRQDFFLLALLTATTSKNVSTHTIDQRFFRIVRELESVPFSIVALPATGSQSEYRSVDSSSSDDPWRLKLNSQSDAAASTSTSSVEQIDGVHASLQTSLEDASERVNSSEAQIACLKEEIDNLKKRVKISKDSE